MSFFLFSGCRICTLLAANPDNSRFEVSKTVRDHKTYGVNSDNKPRAGVFELVSQSVFVRFSVGEFPKSFQEGDVVWTAAIAALHSRST